ncbi:autophagy- protein 2 [Boothiomyces sp. JEL0866]|nr:autophagy- protein 2 [Boothiomyces sp. JEL0866]
MFLLNSAGNIQQKLVKYLIKSTLGKILQDVNWDQLDYSLVDGVCTLNCVALNSKLFNEALNKKGLYFKSGIIQTLKIQIPWKSFYKDSCSMVLQDITISICRTDVEYVAEQPIPVLSSSFHFAGDFIRSEIDTDPTISNEQTGLNDLAEIIENIIGKATVSLENIKIQYDPNLFSDGPSGKCITLSAKKFALCDHISMASEIPEKIKVSQADILSLVVKYLKSENIEISFNNGEYTEKLVSLDSTWVRLLFSQQLSGSQIDSSSNDEMADSVIFSDFNISILSDSAISILNLNVLNKLREFFKTPRNHNLIIGSNQQSVDVQDAESDILQFSIILEKFSLTVIPIEQQPLASYYETASAQSLAKFNHIQLDLSKIKFSSIKSQEEDSLSFFFEIEDYCIKEYNSAENRYEEYFSKWNNSSILNNSELYKKITNQSNYVDQSGSIKIYFDLFHQEISNLWRIAISFPATQTKLNLKFLSSIQSYTPKVVVESETEPQADKESSKGTVMLNISHWRLVVDLEVDDCHCQHYPVVDICNPTINLDTTLQQKDKTTINFILPAILFGIIEPETGLTEHLLGLTDLKCDLNQQSTEVVGLYEDLILTKHKYLREQYSEDAMSSKSWSDVDPESSPVRTTSNPLGFENVDMLDGSVMKSKILVVADVGQVHGDFSKPSLDKMQSILDMVQKLSLKTPPEVNAISLAALLTIHDVELTYDVIGDQSFIYEFRLHDVDVVTSLGSANNSKNLLLLELYGNIFEARTTSNGKHTMIIDKLFTMDEKPMFHLIFSQNDDIDMALRNITTTAIFTHFFLHLPFDFKTTDPSDPKSNSNVNQFDSFNDLMVIFSDVQIAHVTEIEPVTIYRVDFFKVTSNIISESPTNGIYLRLFNLQVLLGVMPSIKTYLETYSAIESSKSIQRSSWIDHLNEIGLVQIISLDNIKSYIRTNKSGALPELECEISFNQLNLDFCSDSLNYFLDYCKSFSPSSNSDEMEKSTTTTITKPDIIDTFDSIDDSAFVTEKKKDGIMEEDEEVDWNFEEIPETDEFEGTVVDNIKILNERKAFKLIPNFIQHMVKGERVRETEPPQTKLTISEGNISWRLYAGSHWQHIPHSISPSSEYDAMISDSGAVGRIDYQVEMHFLKLYLNIELFPIASQSTKHIQVRIGDIEIIDNLKTSQWKKFLTYQAPLAGELPRETGSDMIIFDWNGYRTDGNEEYRVKAKILPIQMYIDQDTLIFLENFFSVQSSNSESPESGSTRYVDETFFQLFELDPISIQMDYKPKHVDYSSLKGGKLTEMINFLHIDGAKLYLTPVRLSGIYGWQKLFSRILDIWLPHIVDTQITNLASGVSGIKSIVNIGTGLADLVLLPIEQFKQDGRILRGISRGASSFVKTTTIETVKIGTKLASGAQNILETTQNSFLPYQNDEQKVSKLADQPKDLAEGLKMGLQSLNQGVAGAKRLFQPTSQESTLPPGVVPAAMLQPVIGLTEALAKTLVGLSNTLDKTQSKRMNDKYKRK